MERSSEEWSTEEQMMLIDIWSQIPELFDTSNKDYYFPTKRAKFLNVMAKELNRTDHEVSRKMKMLLRNFASETQKYKLSLQSGDPDGVYKITWKYYEPLAFLNKNTEARLGVERVQAVNGTSDPLESTESPRVPRQDAVLLGSGNYRRGSGTSDMWSPDDIYELIDMWKELPVFYDPSVKLDRAVRLKRDRHVRMMAKRLNKTEDAVKKRMKNLRTVYLFQTKKHEALLKSGDPDADTFIKWQYYGALSFLGKSPEQIASTMQCDYDTTLSDQNDNDTQPPFAQTLKTERFSSADLSVLRDDLETLDAADRSSEDGSASSPRKRHKPTAARGEDVTIQARLRDEDETDMFCAHVAAELRQLPRNVRRTTKFRIQQVLYEAQVAANQATVLQPQIEFC